MTIPVKEPKKQFGWRWPDLHYSDFRLFTGFNRAALIAWKLTVRKVMTTATEHDAANTHHGIFVLYSYDSNQLFK